MTDPVQVPGPVAAQACGPLDFACQAAQGAANAFAAIVAEVARGAAELVVTTSTWWVQTSSINPLDPAVQGAQRVLQPLVVAILVASVLLQAGRMIVMRKAEPLITLVTGLLRFAAVNALGLTGLQALLQAGDALAVHLLDNAAVNFATFMQAALLDGDATLLVLLVSLLAAVLSLIQWLLMEGRHAGLLVLAAMLTLAASGSATRTTQRWSPTIWVWVLALAGYKPAAAMIYFVGFSYIGSGASAGGSGHTLVTGMMVLLLAVLAMPALLKLFAWSGTQLGGSGNGSAFLGAAGAVAMSQSYRPAGSVDRAATVESSGPGSQPTHSGYASPSSSPGGSAPPGASTPGSGATTGSPATGSTGTAAAGTATTGTATTAAAGVAGAVGVAATATRAVARGAADQMTGPADGQAGS